MSENLTYILSRAEIAPPANCWNQIQDRLNNEFDISDSSISSRILNTEISPPILAWQNIVPYLADKDRFTPPIVQLKFKKLAIAASIIGLIGITTWSILRLNGTNDIDKALVVTNSVAAVVSPQKDNPVTTWNSLRKKESGKKIQSSSESIVRPSKQISYPGKQRILRSRNYPPTTKVATIAPIQPISIKARSIRDASGNLVMDMSLLKSSGNDHYITVTSPNGQQTRISDKFLNMIHYLNAQDDDYNFHEPPERQQWKTRIKEWKSRLLEQAGYFPANNNFLGIMELKELIQDK